MTPGWTTLAAVAAVGEHGLLRAARRDARGIAFVSYTIRLRGHGNF